MKLGISHVLAHESPRQWAEEQRALGLESVVFPVDYTAPDAVIAAYADACREQGLLIAEVGAWSNPLSENREEREEALRRCKGQLRLAEELGARCCVNIAGAFAGSRWDGFCRENYTEEAFEATVRCVREIVDAVHPKRTAYCLEAMQWMVPDSPAQYEELMRKIDREGFAAHVDLTNWVYTPRSFLYCRELIDEIFDRLGESVRSCHLKDSRLHERATCLLEEVPVGLGGLDIRHYVERAEAADPDMPMIIEHLRDDREYREAIERMKKIADGKETGGKGI